MIYIINIVIEGMVVMLEIQTKENINVGNDFKTLFVLFVVDVLLFPIMKLLSNSLSYIFVKKSLQWTRWTSWIYIHFSFVYNIKDFSFN